MIWQPEWEEMERKDLEALQLQRLRDLLARLQAKVPFYRRKMEEAGVGPEDLRRLEDLRKFPFTTKGELREQYPLGLLAIPPEDVARIHGSSGTKGKPTLVAYSRRDIQIWAEVCARSIAAAGGEPGHFLHNAYGYGLFTGGLGLHFGAEALGVGVIPAGGGQSLRQIRLLEDLKPQGISCTPSYALTLVDVMEKEGVDPRGLGTRYGIFGAEPWSEAMRRAIEEAWGLKAVDIYGLSEIIGPGVGCECVEAQAGPHVNEDHFLVEVVDPETGELLGEGEVGELVFTTLTKEAMPLLRYRTGDLAAVEPPGCACGRTFRRISRIKGRTDDMIILRGVNVFPSEVERVILSFSELAPHYRLVLRREDRLDELEVQVEATPRVWDPKVPPLGLQQKIAHRLHEDLGVRLAVVVLPPGSLPRSEGKALRVVDAREEKG